MSSLTISARRWHIYRVRYLLYTAFLRVPRTGLGFNLPHFDFLQGDMNTVKGNHCGHSLPKMVRGDCVQGMGRRWSANGRNLKSTLPKLDKKCYRQFKSSLVNVAAEAA